MTQLEQQINMLNEDLIEMMYLVKTQLEKNRKAFFDYDTELAHEIHASEKRVDTLELKIDRDCENVLALHNPVAVDLRFVIACFKINSDLERLGDHANSIAKYILDFGGPIDQDIIERMKLDEMFDVAIKMVSNVFSSYISEDTALARKVFARDEILNEIQRNSSQNISKVIREDPDNMELYLYLFSIIQKLERVGDLTKNVAEEIIFYLEAKVLKHKKDDLKKGSHQESDD
ncbi:MAG: phosphate signaling complex protein PhoU [Bacteroidota bacterium]